MSKQGSISYGIYRPLGRAAFDYARPTHRNGKPRETNESATNRRYQRNNQNLAARDQPPIPKMKGNWTPAKARLIRDFVRDNIDLNARLPEGFPNYVPVPALAPVADSPITNVNPGGDHYEVLNPPSLDPPRCPQPLCGPKTSFNRQRISFCLLAI